MVLGIGPGDDVICSPVTCMADPHTIRNAGANIVWADCNPMTGLVEEIDVQIAMTLKTKAVLLTDVSGMTPKTIYENPNVATIQDAAQNFSGRLWGDFVAVSCQAIKFLTTGDGGFLIVRTTKEDARKARLMRWFGLDRTASTDFRCQQNIAEPGGKLHLTDLCASMGLANLPLALDSVKCARANARWYQDNLPRKVLVPWDETGTYWTYMILVAERAKFMENMAAEGIHTSPVQSIGTRHDLFPKADLPGAQGYSARNLAIPSGYWVSPEDRQRIADAVWRFA
jgi:dTDP-4-amino-4,6-dideoxygalactose transaminase